MPKIEFSAEAFPKLQDYICPISQELVSDPVVAADGHLYNEQDFNEWLNHSNASPVTGETLRSEDFYYSYTIAHARDAVIKQYDVMTETEFFDAVKKGSVELLQEKKYFDSYLTFVNKQNQYAVSVAIEEKNIAMLRYLIAEGATIDEYEYLNDGEGHKAADFPLARACQNGFEEGIALLLTKNPTKFVSKHRKEKTVLHFAIKGNVSLDIIKQLVKHFPDIQRETTRYGASALHYAAYYTENAELIRYLVQQQVNINAEDNDDEAPLHWLCEREDMAEMSKEKVDALFAMADAILDLGANPKSENYETYNPLELAARSAPLLHSHIKKRLFSEERFQTLESEHLSLKRKHEELQEAFNRKTAFYERIIETMEQQAKAPRPLQPEPAPTVVSTLMSLFSIRTPQQNPTSISRPPTPH